MKTRARIGRIPVCFLLLLIGCLLGSQFSITTIAATPDSALPAELQKELDDVVKARVGAIMAQKNDKGESYKRANASKTFRKIDDSTYEVGLVVDSAQGNDLLTERFVLTLKSDAKDNWAIAKEELKDTYKELHRGVFGDEECFHFDGFALAKEGLTLKASNGSMCKDFYNGKLARFVVSSTNLSYEFIPPVKKEEMLFHSMKKDKTPDLVFKPDYARIECDPNSCQQMLSSLFTGLTPLTMDATVQPIQKFYDTRKKDAEKNLHDNPFWGYRRPYEQDRKYFWIGCTRPAMDDQTFFLEYDSYEPKEVAVGTASYGTLYRYYGEETRKSGIDPYDLEGRPDIDARNYDLVSLKGTVELGFGDGETLTGDITYGLTTKKALREIPFGIARIFQTSEKKERKDPKMMINSLQDAEGNDLTWTRTGLYTALVVLPKEVPAGTPLTLRLRFENRDSIYKLTSSFSYVDRGGWLPLVRFGDFIKEFDMTVRVPARYKTLGIGKKVSDVKEGGASVTRWIGENPVSFPSITFGDYFETTSKVKATKLDGSEIPVVIHVDRQSMSDNYAGVAEEHQDTEGYTHQTLVTFKISQQETQNFVDKAATALNLYRDIYGIDYPFGKLDLVNDPLGGFYGQSPSSLIYLGNPDFFSGATLSGALTLKTEDGREVSGLSTFQDSVVPHEVAHQWWGSLVCNVNENNYWFVESLAEYSSALFTEKYYGKAKYFEHVQAWRKEILEADMRSSVQDGYTVWAGPGGFRSYRAALYAKGPYAFHIMRSTWGDEAFFKFLKNLMTELKGKEIVTRDIQKIAEKSFGANLDWFFDQWLRGVGLPQFNFNYTVRAAENGQQIVEGEVVQRLLLRPASSVKEVLEGQFFKGIIPITVVGKSGKEYRKRLVIEGEKTAFKFNIPEPPKEIVFNKYGESLGYDTVVNASQ